MTWATTLDVSNFEKLRILDDFINDKRLIFDCKSSNFPAKKQKKTLIFAKIINIFAQIKKKQ